jgi:hypothetical protein
MMKDTVRTAQTLLKADDATVTKLVERLGWRALRPKEDGEDMILLVFVPEFTALLKCILQTRPHLEEVKKLWLSEQEISGICLSEPNIDSITLRTWLSPTSLEEVD